MTGRKLVVSQELVGEEVRDIVPAASKTGLEDHAAKISVDHGQRVDAPLMGDDPATIAVNGLFADLRDRRLLKWIFGGPGSAETVMAGLDRIDDEAQVEIAEQWRRIVRLAFAGTPPPESPS